MIRRSYSIIILTIAFLTFGAISSMSQILITSGVVELENDDKTRTPVAGALIEVFRTDVKGGFPSRKTSKGGDFTIAGLQPGATYVLSVSAPGAAPTIFPNVKGGQEKLLIIMKPGDGKKWTEEEVRKAIAGGVAAGNPGQASELTAEEKKLAAENEAKKKEIEARNANVAKTNQIVNQALKDGDAAFRAKDYDLAIVKFTEGYEADREFVGSAPVMLNNKATALRSRAVDLYNKNVKNTDIAAKLDAMGKVKADFAESLNLYNTSFTLLKNANSAEAKDPNIETFKKGALQGAQDTVRVMVLTEQVADGSLEIAAAIMPEYVNAQTELSKKNEGMVMLADLYRVGFQQDKAIALYKKVLETSPDNLEALNGAGLCLVNLGYIDVENAKNPVNKALADEGKAKLQEGSNLLQKFASLAPDDNKFKADALGLIETLKKEQNVTPQKVTSTKKKN